MVFFCYLCPYKRLTFVSNRILWKWPSVTDRAWLPRLGETKQSETKRNKKQTALWLLLRSLRSLSLRESGHCAARDLQKPSRGEGRRPAENWLPVNPLSLVKPSDDHSPGWQLGYNAIRDLELEPPASLKLRAHRNYEIINARSCFQSLCLG